MIIDPLTDRHNNISECRCPAANNRTTSNDERSMCLFAAFHCMHFCSSSSLLLITTRYLIHSQYDSTTRYRKKKAKEFKFRTS